MNIIFPIAGRGSRFLQESEKNPEYAKPKPLIDVAGYTMIEWAAASLPKRANDKLIFLVLKEHVDQAHIDEVLKKKFGEDIKIITVDEVTQGPACTVLLAKEYINNDEPLLIANSDNYVDGKTLFRDIESMGSKIDGFLSVFYATGPKWSFSKADDEGYVVEVAEKIQISRNASNGFYYFSKGRDFVWAAEEMIEENDRSNNEFYVAPVYNYLIRRGKLIKLSRSRFVHNFGVPRDLEKFLIFLRYNKVDINFSNLKL
jgi:NDP-sugar pyrophosphorylase family protein